ATETVRRLAELRPRTGLAVSVNHTVISARSLADHPRLRAQFRPLGVDVQAVPAHSDSAMYGIKRAGQRAPDLIPAAGSPLRPARQGADCDGLVRDQLRELAQVRDPLVRFGKRYYLRGLLARLRHQPRPRPRPKCVALRSHLRLLPDGSVPVCQFNT